MIRRLFLLLSVAGVITACSGSPDSPSATAATINGSVVASSPASGPSDEASADASNLAGLVVSVVGGKGQTTVDADGNFTLKDVKAGDVVLRFRGTDLDANVTVAGVQGGQSITIVVSIANGSLELSSDDRETTAGAMRQLEGRIDAIPPVSAAAAFVVDGTTVTTNASTVFTGHGSTTTFADLAVGVRVHMAGTASGAGLLAATVDIQNTNATLPVIVNGIAETFTGTASGFSFTVNDTIVQGDSTAAFTGNSSFADLANGKRVEVKGLPGNGFVTATSIHVNPK